MLYADFSSSTISFILALFICYFLFFRPFLKANKAQKLCENKINELKWVMKQKEKGKTLYVEDLKYLTKEDLKRHLKNVRFIDEK